MKAHLDTHVALCSAAGEKRKLRPARALLLRELGRIREPVNAVMDLLAEDAECSQEARVVTPNRASAHQPVRLMPLKLLPRLRTLWTIP